MLTWVVFFGVCIRSEKNRSCWGYSRRRIWKLNRSDSMKRDRNERCSEESKNFRRLRRSKLWTRLLLSRKQLWGQRLWKTWQRRWCVFLFLLLMWCPFSDMVIGKSKQLAWGNSWKQFPWGKKTIIWENILIFFLLLRSLWKKKATQSNQSIPFLQQYNMPFLPYTQPSRVLLKHCFPSHRSSPSLSGVRECFERCKICCRLGNLT